MEGPHKFPETPLVNRMRIAMSRLFLMLLLSRDPESTVIHIHLDVLLLDSRKLEGCGHRIAVVVCVKVYTAIRGLFQYSNYSGRKVRRHLGFMVSSLGSGCLTVCSIRKRQYHGGRIAWLSVGCTGKDIVKSLIEWYECECV